MTTVSETLSLPGGGGPATVRKAKVRVRLVAAATEGFGYGTATIGGVWEPDVNGDGEWSLDLEPNADISPEDTVYEIVVSYPDRPSVTRYIEVPDTAAEDVVDILTVQPSSPGTTVGAGAMIFDPDAAHSIDDTSVLVRDALGDLSTDIATGWVPTATGASYRRGLRAGMADALRGTGPLRIVGIGTSIMQGWSASAYADYWFTIAQTRLAAKLGLTGIGPGLVGCAEGFGYDSGWTESGTIAGNGTGMKQWGATIPVGGYIEQTFTCDRILIHGCKQNFLRGAVEILIDGVLGGPNAVAGDGGTGKYQSYNGSLAASAYGSAWQWDSGALSAGSHTVRIRQATGTGGDYPGIVSEVMVFNGDHGTLEMWNAGHYGYSTAQYDTPSGSSIGWAEWLQFIDPHAVMVVHGVNDWGTGSAADVAAFETQLQSVVDYIAAKTDITPSIILGVDQLVNGRDPEDWEQFRLATYRVARANGCEVFDFDQLCGNMATTGDDVWTLMSGDQIHPANRGHYVMGHAVADWLGAFPVEAGSAGAVSSVNGETGAVTLSAADIGSTASGDVAATNVDAAIAELASEKLAKAGGTMTGQLVTTAGSAAAPGLLVGSGAGLFNPSTDRLSVGINNGGTIAERFRITVNQMLAFAGSNALPSYAHNLDAGTGFQPGLAGAGVSVTGTQVFAWSATGADAKSLKIVNVANATAATDALNRQTGDARYFLVTETELAALAALTSAADRLPYFTGSGTAALATYTAAARTWDAYASAAAQLAGLSGAATASFAMASQKITGLAAGTASGDAAHMGQVGMPLGQCIYNPGTTATYARSSATPADVDASNIVVTFTATTTAVRVRVTFRSVASAANVTMALGLRESTTDIATINSVWTGANQQIRSGIFHVTGLTPGNSYTYKLSYASDGAATWTIRAGGSAGDAGPIVMEVNAA